MIIYYHQIHQKKYKIIKILKRILFILCFHVLMLMGLSMEIIGPIWQGLILIEYGESPGNSIILKFIIPRSSCFSWIDVIPFRLYLIFMDIRNHLIRFFMEIHVKKIIWIFNKILKYFHIFVVRKLNKFHINNQHLLSNKIKKTVQELF